MLAPYFSELKKRLGQVHRKVRFAQACEEGSDAQSRYTLEKYGVVIEEQRRFISDYRNNILFGNKIPAYFKTAEPEMYQQYVAKVGIGGVTKAEVQLTLYFINQHWADYLSTMENVRNGIHLMILGGLEPIVEYHRMAAEAFSAMKQDIEKDVILYMKTCKITEDGIDMKSEGLIGATTTWTYAIDDSKRGVSREPCKRNNLTNNSA